MLSTLGLSAVMSSLVRQLPVLTLYLNLCTWIDAPLIDYSFLSLTKAFANYVFPIYLCIYINAKKMKLHPLAVF